MEIINLIESAKNRKTGAMEELINKFTPLIDKYYRKMAYDEDIKSSLTLKLIELILNDIPTKCLKKTNDGAVVSYISKALYNHYIYLSKANSKISKYEELIDNTEEYGTSFSTGEDCNALIMRLLCESVLTKMEAHYIYLIYYMGYTSEQVANVYGISKQAVNQSKNRALKKLRKCYLMS